MTKRCTTKMRGCLALLAAIFVLTQLPALAQNNVPCPRFPAGSTISQPADLFSQNGVLLVNLTYQTMVDQNGLTRFCFKTLDGKQSPTLHVNPGDHLVLTITNLVPANAPGLQPMHMHSEPGVDISSASGKGVTVCGAANMTPSSVNVHYHGANISPTCHSDEVIRTIVNSGQSFVYNITFPTDEPPGLYWYHPHIHGIAEEAVEGGATGAIVVEGLQNIQPAVAGLPQRLLVLRDNPVPNSTGDPSEPAWDISVNYTPVAFPNYTPAVIPIRPSEKQLWRVANTAAGTIMDLQLQYDGVAQTLGLVGLDGVPTGSQDGTRLGKIVNVKHILIPPAGRAEFIMTGPSLKVRSAKLVTNSVDTGPDGDNDPARPIATLKASANAPEPALRLTTTRFQAAKQRFEGLKTAAVTTQRKLYFSEDNPNGQFFITVEGATPTLFDPTLPPAIITTQGSVEDWTIENRAQENHEFHMHQIHFLLLAVNGVPVPASRQQFLDMVDLPYWSGTGPYPSVTVRMDFRGPDIGDFVYHCHILEHEDKGMMQIIRVVPASAAVKTKESDKATATSTPAKQPAHVHEPAANEESKPIDLTELMGLDSGLASFSLAKVLAP
jgi:FtsP/CotA-like multicopper oxidase with cupredoxin domain